MEIRQQERRDPWLKVSSGMGTTKTPRELDLEKLNKAEYGERFAPLEAPRDALKCVLGAIWVEPRENSLAPVGGSFLFNNLLINDPPMFHDGSTGQSEGGLVCQKNMRIQKFIDCGTLLRT